MAQKRLAWCNHHTCSVATTSYAYRQVLLLYRKIQLSPLWLILSTELNLSIMDMLGPLQLVLINDNSYGGFFIMEVNQYTKELV